MIKREDVASCCELQTCCLVLLQLPRCLETIMALQHLPLFDMLFNPQLLRAFGRNKHRRRNKASLCSLTTSWSVTSGVWNHSRERGVTLSAKDPKQEHAAVQVRNIQLLKTSCCLSLEHWQWMIIMWQVISFYPLTFVNGQWHALL